MTVIDHLLREPAAQAIGWALLHFVWQGTVVALLTALALAALRRGDADVRYVVAAIGLSLMVTLPTVTAIQFWRSATVTPSFARAEPAGDHIVPAPGRPIVGADQTATESAPSSSPRLDSIRVEPWLPMMVLAWLLGVVVLSLRLMSGWLWVQRIKSHGTSPAADGWDLIAERLCRRLHITRPVRLLESTIVDVPTVIGWMKPVILMPASALAGLSPHQLEAILAHELAHIRRHDYLVNLLQTVVETLLFYHPAVWWLSRRIRAERENCCDDLAVSLCGDPYTYARALANLEELRAPGRHFVLAASGGSLVQRVRRLLGAPSHAGRAPGWLAGSASVFVLLGLAAGSATDAFQAASAPAVPAIVAAPASAPAPAVVSIDPAVAAQASAPAASMPVRAADFADRARKIDETDRALQSVTAAHVELLFQREQPMAAIAPDRLDASTPSLLPALADAHRTMVALDGALVASTPVVAPTAVAVGSVAIAAQQSHGTYSWSHNGEKVEIKCDGDVEFSDDDMDVKSVSPGGLLRIRDGGMMTSLLGGHTVEFKADGSGNITRRYWVGSSERPFDPEGRKWVASVLPRFIRQSGIGAPARVARILKQKGPAGVLAEISLIEGSWSKRRYFSELLKTTTLDPGTVRQALVQAGREIDSDFELASLLIENAEKLLVDDATRQAYFDASRSIDSDFEMHRVFSAALKRGPVAPTVLVSMLNASRNIDSDFELASLLVDVGKLQPLDATTRPAFFSALDTVHSDFEHHRVLAALTTRSDLAPETTAAMLASGAVVDSDFEAASFLLELVKRQSIEGSLRAPFFRAVDTISSSFERGRVLQAVAKRPDASPETIVAVLRAAAGMGSSFETSQVLMTVASNHVIEGPARDAYIAAAEKLGDFEQGRTLSALVKSERRK